MALNFSASIDRNIQSIKQKVNDRVYKISIELFLLVVKKTPSPSEPGPYAKGVLANQWYPKAGDFSDEVGGDKSRDGAGSRNRITALRGGKDFFKDNRLTLTNNIEYAYRAEALGWAGTPAYRMVALSLQEIAAKYT